jgi:hypothetical protein
MFVVYNKELNKYRGRTNSKYRNNYWVADLKRAKVYVHENSAIRLNSILPRTEEFKAFLEKGGRWYDFVGQKHLDPVLPPEITVHNLKDLV